MGGAEYSSSSLSGTFHVERTPAPGTAEAVTAAPEHGAGTEETVWCFNAAVDLKSRSGLCREESVLWDLLLFQPSDANTSLTFLQS